MLSILIGLVVMGLSVWGMIVWSHDLGAFLRGFIPFSFFFGGLIAVIAGASSQKKTDVPAVDPTEDANKKD